MEKNVKMPKVKKIFAIKPYKKKRKRKHVSPRERKQRKDYYRKNKRQIKKAAERWRRAHKTRIKKY